MVLAPDSVNVQRYIPRLASKDLLSQGYGMGVATLNLKRHKAKRAGLLLAVLVTVTAAGCGKSERSGNGDRTVRYSALPAKLRGLDPMDIGDTTSALIAGRIFDCLYQYHYLKRPYELVPCLAADFPEISDDKLTYTFRLRDDLYFADDPCFESTGGRGRQVVAEDFMYAWKRVADIKNVSKNWWVFEDHIVGLDEFREYTQSVKQGETVDYSREVEGLQAPDKLTLVVTLKKPWPQILYLLAHEPTAPVAREAVTYYGKELLNHPVGTGAFMLKSWVRGSKLVMVRNPRYRRELYPSEGEPGEAEKGLLDDAGKPLPFIDEIQYQVIIEDQPRWLLFMQGNLDASAIPKDNYDQAIDVGRQLKPEMAEKGIDLTIFPDPSTFWYGFNMEDPVVGRNKPLRRAMSMAFNREEYIEIFTNNRGEPARSVLPPVFKEYDPEGKNPNCEYNPQRASKLLEEAVRVHGGPLPAIQLFMPGTDTTFRQMGDYARRTMEAVGIELDVAYMDWPTFQDRVKTKSAQMFAMGWIADYPDPENFMQLFYSKNSSPGPNNFNYSNPEFDELYLEAAAMPDGPERVALYRRMDRIVQDDCPTLLTLHRVAYVLKYDWLLNYKPHVFAYNTLKYQRVDVEARRRAVGR